MPDLTGVRRRIAQRLDELNAEEGADASAAEAEEERLPTPEEILAEREAARQEGFAEGQVQGQLQGYEDGRAQGYAEGEATGQQAGFDAGYQRGLEQARHEVDQQLARLQGLIEQLQGPVARLDDEVEGALLSLVDLVSRAILRREISLDRAFLADVLRESVAALPVGHQRLRIFIHPEDQPLAEAACRDLLEECRLVPDPAITPGGVRVETLQSLVDSTLENRYKKVIDQLLDAGYRVSDSSLKPLPADVLSTPDSPPLETMAFTEPLAGERMDALDAARKPVEVMPDLEQAVAESATDKSVEPEAAPDVTPPVKEPARVSLQRGGAPRKLSAEAADASANSETPPSPPQPDAVLDSESDELLEPAGEPAAGLVEQVEADEDAFFEQAFDALAQQSEGAGQDDQAAADTGHSEAELDAFLEGFEEDTSVSEALQVDDQDSVDLPTEQVAEVEAEEKTWAPESVHDDRYLEDVLENTWMDDLEASLKDEEPPESASGEEQQ